MPLCARRRWPRSLVSSWFITLYKSGLLKWRHLYFHHIHKVNVRTILNIRNAYSRIEKYRGELVRLLRFPHYLKEVPDILLQGIIITFQTTGHVETE